MTLDTQVRRMETVIPNEFGFLSIPFLGNIFGVKIIYDCGLCGYTQKVRVPLKDEPVVACEYCNTLNKFPLVTTPYLP